MGRFGGARTSIATGILLSLLAGCDANEPAQTPDDAASSLPDVDGGVIGNDDAMGASVPLLDDAGIPINTACLESPDGGLVLDLELVEVKGSIAITGLNAVPDCKQGLLVSPASNPARIHLVEKTDDHAIPVDCKGNFRALVPPGDYKLYATIYQTTGTGSFTWAVTLADTPIELRKSTTLPGPYTIAFHTFSGKVTFNEQQPFAQLASSGQSCFAMTLDERRTGAVFGTRAFFTADCAGNFSVPVPAGQYSVDLMGPVAGKEALTRVAAGNWPLNAEPIVVKGDTAMSGNVPLVKITGIVNTNIPMPCGARPSRIDLRASGTGTQFSLPLCNGGFDGFVSPGSYTTTLVQDVGNGDPQDVGNGSVRAPLGTSGTFSALSDRDNITMNVGFKTVTGSVFVDDVLSTNPENSGTATVVFLGKQSSGFTAWVTSGKPMQFSATLPADRYDIMVNAAKILPGGSYAEAKYFDITNDPPPMPFDIRLKSLVIRGEVQFGGLPPRADDCSGYTIIFQPDQAFAGITVIPTCVGGKMVFETRVYPGRYQIVVRRANADTEFPVPNIVFSSSMDNLIVPLAALDERPVRGFLKINGCLLRESANTCASTYTVTLRDAKQGVSYVMAPAFQDQPFSGRALPGNYRAYVRFSSTCPEAPFASVTDELLLPGVVLLP
jgi:hypothetical protein